MGGEVAMFCSGFWCRCCRRSSERRSMTFIVPTPDHREGCMFRVGMIQIGPDDQRRISETVEPGWAPCEEGGPGGLVHSDWGLDEMGP